MSERLAILAEGLFDDYHAKTAHGVIRYGQREVVAVIDSRLAGRTAEEVMPFCLHPVPIVATVADAVERGAQALLIGVAPTGGKLDASWRAVLLDAIGAGLHVEAGLHTQLSEDPELRRTATRAGVAPAAAIASLADWVDLDGHLLLADEPFTGLRFEDGRVLPSAEPGLGVQAE